MEFLNYKNLDPELGGGDHPVWWWYYGGDQGLGFLLGLFSLERNKIYLAYVLLALPPSALPELCLTLTLEELTSLFS